jgi:hypothetical protein
VGPKSDTLNRAAFDELTQPGFASTLQDWLMRGLAMDRYKSVGASLLNICWRVKPRPSRGNALRCDSLYENFRCTAREPKYQRLSINTLGRRRDPRQVLYPRTSRLVELSAASGRPVLEKLRLLLSKRDGDVYRSAHGIGLPPISPRSLRAQRAPNKIFDRTFANLTSKSGSRTGKSRYFYGCVSR